MKTEDNINADGTFKLQVYKNGILIKTIHESNMVVMLGLQNMAYLLGGHASGKKIEKIAVGTNATDPVLGDTLITNSFIKPIDNISYPDAQTVLFSFDIDNTEANGMTIREFGLLNSDNVLCARKVRTGEIIKTSAIRLVGTWKLTFS